MKYSLLVTDAFDRWLKKLKDNTAIRAISMRLARVRAGNLGDIKFIGGGIYEMRIFVGKGYRLYYTFKGEQVILLLCGGDKTSQQRDIVKAQEIMKTLE